MSSKRHSMPVGPRPLQLTSTPLTSTPLSDGVPSAPPTPVSHSSSPLSPSVPDGAPRRSSSILYNPPTRPTHSAGHRSTLGRSNSVGGSLDWRKSVPERSPVTLTEKHADLLQFIAQKEAKCLELRSQLAMHEAELLQLKRKWERIVSRGFTSPHNTSFASNSSGTPSSSSLENSPNPTSANGGAVLDGIREGVQGVGRFIAAFSPAPYTSLESVISPHRTHSTSSSISTIGTSTSVTDRSTRLSQSSASSIGEEPVPSVAGADINSDADLDSEPDAQVLMVHDTGATPTMSPNPAYTARREQRQQRSRTRPRIPTDSSAEAEADFFADVWPTAASTPTRAARPAAKRPVSMSAIAGLSLVDSVAPVSSWVGTVGKKWEELQRAPTIAKNTKRASLLFSDIASALQVASPSPSPSNFPSAAPAVTASPSPSTSSASLLDDDWAADAMMPQAPALTPAPATTLKLSARAATTRQRQQQQQPPHSPLSLAKSKAPPKPKQAQQTQTQTLDDDEEWNW